MTPSSAVASRRSRRRWRTYWDRPWFELSGVGDWLLARRLRAMAEAGTVRVDEAGSTRGFYGAAACLA